MSRRWLAGALGWIGLQAVAGAAPPALNADYPLHALTHARVYVTPEQVLNDATVVIQGNKILEVSQGATPPSGARLWDCRGKVIHAGFIDLYLGDQELRQEVGEASPGPSGLGDRVDDEFTSSGTAAPPAARDRAPVFQADRHLEHSSLEVEEGRLQRLRALGILTLQAVPQKGLFRGQGNVYSLRSNRMDHNVLKPASCQVVGIRTVDDGATEADYPASLMGNLAEVRQAFREAEWWEGQKAPADERYRATWKSLREALQQGQPVYEEGRDLLEGLALHRVLREVSGLNLKMVVGPDAALRPEWLPNQLVLRLDGQEIPAHPARRSEVSYARLARWKAWPGLPQRLAQSGKEFCLTAHGLDDWEHFPRGLELLQRSGASTPILLEALTRRPARWLGMQAQLGTLEPGKLATLVVRSGEPFALASTVEQCWVEGKLHRLQIPKGMPDPLPAREGPAELPVTGWQGPASVLIQGARIWNPGNNEQPSTLEDLLVINGKIVARGPALAAPAGVAVKSGQGLHLIPGLVDAHSHTAVVGDVNEGTLTTTAQVDIGDVVNPLDFNIQLQLSGGVTCAHVLHGSANAIGGRTLTLKWRWGGNAEQLRVDGALPGIKFALGENPKQSNWGDSYKQRYPQTRQGVAALIRQRFLEARRYREQQKTDQPPRPDAGLEALVEVLEGKRLLHCHSYRQDEILMLLRVAEEMGFRIATLQHGLEAYKVADEVAAHGAGVSCFSDWWAYKQEVMDAIPYNGALLHQRGVVTSFNSDSNELARRLLGEAAKAVRYGGLSQAEALAFITLNPARQLGLGQRLGSLEVGKDGDFSLWTGSPFDPTSRCLETFIEGRLAWEQASYAAEQQRRRELRKAWLEKALP